MATQGNIGREQSPSQAFESGQAGGRGPDEFTDFLNSKWRGAVTRVRQLGVPASDAEDVVNGAFMRLEKDWYRIKYPPSWFNRVLFWEAQNWLAKRPPQPVDISQLTDTDKIEILATRLENPDDLLAGTGCTDALLNAIHELTSTQQTMLIRRLQKFTHEEIAKELGMTPTAVRQLYSRTVKRLKPLLPKQKSQPGANATPKGTEASA